MLPSLTGGLSGGGQELGGAHGSITIDTSGATRAATTMRTIGQQIDSAMEPATQGIRDYESAINRLAVHPDVPALNAAQFAELPPTMRKVGQETEAAMEKVETSTARAEKPVRSIRSSLFAATAALTGIVLAARRAFSALEAGAELELTADRFDRLATSIGTTGIALRTDLQDATEGLLSDAQSMALATDLIALGLVRTHDEAVRLGRVVTELDADIGELTLALANQTTRRFDQLGISLEGFDERLQRLKLTMDDERAFSMAFLEQAEAQIDRVGGVSQTTAGDIQRLKADWAALNEQGQIALSSWAGPFLEQASGRAAAALREQTDEAIAAAESIGDVAVAYRELNEERERLQSQDAIAFELFVREDFDRSTADILGAIAVMSDSVEDFERTVLRIGGQPLFDEIRAAGFESAEAFYEFATAVQEAESADRVLIQAHQDLNVETERVLTTTEEFIELLTTEHDTKLFEQQLEEVQRFGEALEDLNRLAREGGPDPLAGGGALSLEERQEALREEIELENERGEVILEWAQEVQAIEDEANAARLEATAQHEARRAQVEADFEQQMLEEEQEFNRQRLRQEQKLAADIQGIRDDRARQEAEWFEDLQKSIADAQAQAADDIEELEEEHAERRADIIRRSNLQIAEAAGRLDATAVHRLQQEKKAALEQEQEDYEDSRDEIETRLEEFIQNETEAHEERIRRAREADERRIQELQDSLAERQRIEDEDRQIRLDREKAAHEAQLLALDDAHTARIAQIGTQQGEEAAEYETAFLARMAALGIHHDDWIAEQEAAQEEALDAFDAFWDDMIAEIEEAQAEAAANASILGPIPTQGGFNSLQGISGTGGRIAPPTVSQGGDVSLTFAPGAIQVNAAQGQDEALIAQEVIDEADTLLEVLRSFA